MMTPGRAPILAFVLIAAPFVHACWFPGERRATGDDVVWFRRQLESVDFSTLKACRISGIRQPEADAGASILTPPVAVIERNACGLRQTQRVRQALALARPIGPEGNPGVTPENAWLELALKGGGQCTLQVHWALGDAILVYRAYPDGSLEDTYVLFRAPGIVAALSGPGGQTESTEPTH